jgi:pyruvate,water dikinase
VEAGSPDFPVEFADPADAALTWEWDDMHMPSALAPMAAEYVRTLCGGFNDRYRIFGFPQRLKGEVLNGYAYMALKFDGTPEEQAEVGRRWIETRRSQIDRTGAWWRDEAIPRLKALYELISSVDVAGLPGMELAGAWDAAWDATLEAWKIHFMAILGPYQVMDDLADLYAEVLPDALPGEAVRLTQGHGDDLFTVEVDTETLVAAAERAPAVFARLRAGERTTRDELLGLHGGPEFVEALDSFLSRHGHLGQANEDFVGPSWIEDPGTFLVEFGRRLGRPAVRVARRRERLRAEGDALAAAFRARLAAERPDDLPRFERLLLRAREIGPLTEGHNYWIDRMAQSRLRQLTAQVGVRLALEDSIEEPGDVFYLDRADVREVLVAPSDRRGIVAERKLIHQRQLGIRPPRFVGVMPTEAAVGDRFDGARIESKEADVLRGTGGSAGVVRGPARVVQGAGEFDRVQAGDIVVCPSSNPSWVPIFAIAAGLVTDTGGVLSHAAVVAREYGLPAVVGTGDGTSRIPDGQMVEIDGTLGTVRLL